MAEGQITEAAQGFYELSIIKQLMLLIGISLSIAVGVYVVFWSQAPDLVPVYHQLDHMQTGEVIDTLQKSGIEHKLDPKSGLVLVEASKLFQARIKLAQNGVSGKYGTGFEILDKDTGIGTSQFVEQTRYLRGLQGELERTISSIQNVKSARVHLAIPKQSEFIRNRKSPSASVFVNVYGGYALKSEQISAITHLVASSIQGLNTKDVTVVDQNGNLLSTTGNDKIAFASKNLELVKKIEDTLSTRIEDLIEPIVGEGKVKAKVTALVDFTVREETSEAFDPKKVVVRSEKTLEISKSAEEEIGGIPGALSNEPPVTGTAPETVNNSQDAEDEESSAVVSQADGRSQKRQATRNYEINRKITHQSYSPGKIERLSAAVLVGDKVTYSATGKMEKKPLTDEEIKNIEQLVKDAIGYDDTRNDKISIIRSTFAEPAPIEDLAPEKIYENPMVLTIIKNVLGGIVLLVIVFTVIRPAFKDLTKVSKQKKDMLKRIAGEQGMGEAGMIGTQSAQSLIKVKDIVNEDPKRAAQVIKKWVEVENG